ncbi:MAG TPA: hypothetical protein DEF41_00745 [Desulfovibrio sp.]|nr:hypothetical protein [Desulfovibrio sp.]
MPCLLGVQSQVVTSSMSCFSCVFAGREWNGSTSDVPLREHVPARVHSLKEPEPILAPAMALW